MISDYKTIILNEHMSESYDKLMGKGGITFRPDLTEALPKDGYFVSKEGYQTTIDIDLFDIDFFGIILEKYTDLVEPYEYIGLWVDSNKVYIDISKWFYLGSNAIKFAKLNNQIAIYSLKQKRSIKL